MNKSDLLISAAPRRRRHRRSAGTTMVEFALVAFPFLLMVMGVVDYGIFHEHRAIIFNDAHNAARYAATNPTAWTNAASPATNTIEYLITQGPLTQVPNDDAHILIAYLVPGAGATATQCGHYSKASNAWVSDATDPNTGAAYVQAACVTPGNLVSVKVTWVYTPITPIPMLPSGGITINDTSTVLEEK